MAANTIKVADLAKVQDIEFVRKFNGGIGKLLEVMGKTSTIVLPNGSVLKVYKTTGTLNTDQVGEGEEINLSKYKTELVDTIELEFDKFRKQTTVEAIAKKGYRQAVTETDAKMVLDIQKGIRKDIFTFLATGTGSATGTTFQRALANAWGQLSVAFEDDAATPIYFVNPLDIAAYLGNAAVTMQTAFGFSYIENFLGLGTVVVISDVPQETVYATAKENINVVSCDCGSIEGFDFYGDQTGLIGVAHETTYKNGSLDTVAISGVKLYAECIDRVVKSTIADAIA